MRGNKALYWLLGFDYIAWQNRVEPALAGPQQISISTSKIGSAHGALILLFPSAARFNSLRTPPTGNPR